MFSCLALLSSNTSAAPAVGLTACPDPGRRGRRQPSGLDQVSAQAVSGRRDAPGVAFSDKLLSVV